MGRQLGKLTAMAVNKLKGKGLYADGGNLYLQITSDGGKSWLFRYMMNGKAKMMGLGALHAVSLAEARAKASDYRKQIASDIDPRLARDVELEKAKLAEARQMTFKQCAEKYIAAHEAGWRNSKHRWQWDNTLTRLVYPILGHLPVQDIDVALVLNVLEPIWNDKTETASRVRGRIESILDWASAHGYRQGDNPARWRGHLANLLAKPSQIQVIKHQPALAYPDIAGFMQTLSEQPSASAQALALTILTAVRTNEMLQAKWCEFDLKNKVWIIPSARMKMKKEHRVPLSDPAIGILNTLQEAKTSDYLFPGKHGKPLSNMAMLMLLRRMERKDITVHGFRSTFRDWCAELTNYPREVAEAALAHAVGDRVEAAYRRGDLFEKRRQLMSEWAKYCQQPPKKGNGHESETKVDK